VALRIGFLYGSDVPSTQDLVRQARAGRLFLPREFAGLGPFVHVDDAASAVVAAVEHPTPSPVYNVVDDQPVALKKFLAELARAVDAAPPRHIPRWLVKLAAPVMAEFGSATLTLANDRIKRELGWKPRYPTVETGLAEVRRLAAEAA
jgi:nucleoside-diphosphate-sugar epimerase